jgi:paraquat-inducible protein B
MPDPLPPIPEARAVSRKKTRLSLVWVVPIIAAVVGAWVAVTRVLGQGPEITIVFKSAEGLEAGKTKIHYNGVDVGTIQTIQLSDDHQHVITTAQMAPKTEGFLVDDTQFWVVGPRISGANVTGLSTLISGSYIGMEIGHSQTKKRNFVGLDTPPVVTGDVAGRFFLLKASNLGSLDTGTPIFFRRLQVGEVSSYELDKDGKALSIRVFINAPYDQYVSPNTRFWQASGIDVSLSANGLTLQTQSFLSILVGGIAFETNPNEPIQPPAAADTVFTLFDDHASAFKLPARDPQTYVLVFNDSVRGLAAGAPVEFRGIPIGEVADVRAQVDARTLEFSAPVTIRLDAERLGVKIVGGDEANVDQFARTKLIESMVSRGVRAQLRTGNLLSGALYVAFDFFPDAPPVTIDWEKKPVQLPTMPGDLQAIEANVVSIIKKLDQIPFKQISGDLDKAIVELSQTLASARGTLDGARVTLDSADKLIAPDSVLSAELGATLQEVSRAARSMRVLADYLERHPEALIRGKTGEAK